jgi:3-oxoacid CoA-transferase subunit A
VDSDSLPTPNALIQTVLQAGSGRDEGLEQSRTDHHRYILLLRAGRLLTMIASYIGENKQLSRRHPAANWSWNQLRRGHPQRSCVQAGMAAFNTRTGVGTPVADGGPPQRHGPEEETKQASKPTE